MNTAMAKEGAFPGHGNPKMTAEQKEIARLKKELREAKLERDILKGSEHFLQERWQIFRFIKDLRTIFPIEKMCQVLKVSRRAYYGWLRHKPTERQIERDRLTRIIREIFFKSKRTYGSPRVYIKMKKMGYTISQNQVAAIMRKEGLRSVVKKKHVATTDSKHNHPVAPNLLNQNFMVTEPGQVWVSDITYIRTYQGWLYLTVIIDLWDRKVVGWSLSRSLKAKDTVIPAWLMAVRNRPVIRDLIFHSDRGIQYASNEFRAQLDAYCLVKQSMSRKGNCWDNAVAESFFKNLKMEWVYQQKYRSRMQAALSVFEYIESWYNTDKIHSALEMSIKEFNAISNNHKLVA